MSPWSEKSSFRSTISRLCLIRYASVAQSTFSCLLGLNWKHFAHHPHVRKIKTDVRSLKPLHSAALFIIYYWINKSCLIFINLDKWSAAMSILATTCEYCSFSVPSVSRGENQLTEESVILGYRTYAIYERSKYVLATGLVPLVAFGLFLVYINSDTFHTFPLIYTL